jgi:hypothetical protein
LHPLEQQLASLHKGAIALLRRSPHVTWLDVGDERPRLAIAVKKPELAVGDQGVYARLRGL